MKNNMNSIKNMIQVNYLIKNSTKHLCDYLRLSSTKIIINNILKDEKIKYIDLIYIIKGKTTKDGRTPDIIWMREDIAEDFKIWINKPQNRALNYLRREFSFGENIINNLFSNYKIIKQYPVLDGKYFIDWYVPELKLAIEFDEEHHKNNMNDLIREKEIKNILDCNFIRYCDTLNIINYEI